MRKLFFVPGLAIVAALSAVSPAGGGEVGVEQLKTKTLGWTIRSSLKACLRQSDFPRLKQQKINEIKKMDEKTFAFQYAAAWPSLKQCPALVKRYGLKPDMRKAEVLTVMDGLSLRDCLAAVDSVPDEVLVGQFEQGLDRSGNRDKSLQEQIRSLMANWRPKS